MTTYKVVRFYFNTGEDNGKVIKTGLTRDEAMAHCQDPETSSSTCTTPEALAHTEEHGPWFDGWTEER